MNTARLRWFGASVSVAVLLVFVLTMTSAPYVAADGPTVFMNEIHYDNSGSDTNEGVEIAGPAGTDLTGWQLVPYNGNGGGRYSATALSGSIPDQQNGFGTVWFAILGLQNGAPDGVALVAPGDVVIQFLSYEGSFTATDGPANGMTSTDIDVSETSGTPVGYSLQLQGTGSGYDDFTWTSTAIAHTRDAVNTGQTFQGNEFSITKTAPDMVSPDEVFTYTIVVVNSTGITTTGTVITDIVPTNASFASASDGGVLVGGTTVSWTIPGNFQDGQVVTRTFQVTATSSSGADIANDDYGVQAANWITLAAGSPVTTTVSPLDLIVTKTGPEYAVIGEDVVYVITLDNTGVATATNVILTDTLPMTTTYVADSSGVTPANPSPGVYVWSLGDVSSDTVRTFDLTVTVNSVPGPAGTLAMPLTNRVEVSTDTPGDDPTNNTDAWSLEAYPMVSIYDIQYVDESAGGGFYSNYEDQMVVVEGVVVAETEEIDTDYYSAYVIEDPAGGPWSGLMVRTYGDRAPVDEGDFVRLIGEVSEAYGMTYLYIGNYVNGRQWVISSTNPLPTPKVITTGSFVRTGDTYSAEAYESVLIEFQGTVTDEDVGHGMWEFDDGSGAATGDDEGRYDGDMTYSPTDGDVYNFIRGIGWYSYGEFKLQPRYDADIALQETTPSIIKDAPSLVAPGKLFTYTIIVENKLGFTLNDIVITDVVPNNATFAYTLDGGAESGGVVTWNFASLPSESSVTARFAVTATSSTATIVNDDYAMVASNFTTSTFGTPVGTVVGDEIAIHDIQGAAHLSPLNGQAVSDIYGIVTAERSAGFYMQDPNDDGDIATSEAIFVAYTGSSPTVNVGDEVLVSGTVAEFRYNPAHLSMTRIEEPTVVVSSTDNALPAVIVIGTGGRIPPAQVIDDDAMGNVETSGTFDAADDGIDFYESLEAMLVQVNDAIVVGGTSYGTIYVVGDNGANAGLLTPRGGIVIQSDDFNPEVIHVDDAIIWSEPTVDVGASFSGPITGVIDYNDYGGNYNLYNVQSLPSTTGGVSQEAVTAPGVNELRVASFNVYNLDPGDNATRIANMADEIVNGLQAPDIIGLQEIQDNNGTTDDGTVDATDTYNTLIAAVETAGGPTYEFREIAPLDGQDGGAPGGNIRVGFLFRTDRGLTFVDRPGGDATTATTPVMGASGVELTYSPGRIAPTNLAFFDSRKPLAGEFLFYGQKLIVVVNHFNSKGGDDGLFGWKQPPVFSSEVQRNQQAQVVNDFVDSVLALDSNANVIVLGDLNDFQFSTAVSDTLAANVLTNLMSTLPVNEQYTYIYNGNSQVLDHILVSDNLYDNAFVDFDAVHVNAEFAYFDQRASDHDPVVATFLIEPSLVITKEVEPSIDVAVDSVVAYTITIANNGDADAFGVVITDELPSGITFGGYVSNPGGTAQLPGPTDVITWEYPVASGDSYTFVFTATVTASTLYYDVTNIAHFTSDNGGSGSDDATFTTAGRKFIYLPLVARNY